MYDGEERGVGGGDGCANVDVALLGDSKPMSHASNLSGELDGVCDAGSSNNVSTSKHSAGGAGNNFGVGGARPGE